VIALVALMVFGGSDDTSSDATIGSQAPAFDLVATDGSRETLETALSDGDALLYFSMGPGCDGCFYQIPEIADDLADDGITLIPVMVDPAPRVSAEADRFGIAMPILIDGDRSLSRSYNMIGIYGHQDRPSHSFALVNQDREITWVKHYAEMFVPLEQLLADMRASI
jgi:peroxiredoxin